MANESQYSYSPVVNFQPSTISRSRSYMISMSGDGLSMSIQRGSLSIVSKSALVCCTRLDSIFKLLYIHIVKDSKILEARIDPLPVLY